MMKKIRFIIKVLGVFCVLVATAGTKTPGNHPVSHQAPIRVVWITAFKDKMGADKFMNEMGDITLKRLLVNECKFMLDSDWIQIEAHNINKLSLDNASVAQGQNITLDLPFTENKTENVEFTIQSLYVRYDTEYQVECEIFKRGKPVGKSLQGKCGYVTKKVNDAIKVKIDENGMRPIAQELAAYLYKETGRKWKRKTGYVFLRKLEVVDTGGYARLTNFFLEGLEQTQLNDILLADSLNDAHYFLDLKTFAVPGAGICFKAILEKKGGEIFPPIQTRLANDEEITLLTAATEMGGKMSRRIEDDLLKERE